MTDRQTDTSRVDASWGFLISGLAWHQREVTPPLCQSWRQIMAHVIIRASQAFGDDCDSFLIISIAIHDAVRRDSVVHYVLQGGGDAGKRDQAWQSCEQCCADHLLDCLCQKSMCFICQQLFAS